MAWTRCASAIGAANCHRLSARRFVPAIKRMQRTVRLGEQAHRRPAADPQRRYITWQYPIHIAINYRHLR